MVFGSAMIPLSHRLGHLTDAHAVAQSARDDADHRKRQPEPAPTHGDALLWVAVELAGFIHNETPSVLADNTDVFGLFPTAAEGFSPERYQYLCRLMDAPRRKHPGFTTDYSMFATERRYAEVHRVGYVPLATKFLALDDNKLRVSGKRAREFGLARVKINRGGTTLVQESIASSTSGLSLGAIVRVEGQTPADTVQMMLQHLTNAAIARLAKVPGVTFLLDRGYMNQTTIALIDRADGYSFGTTPKNPNDAFLQEGQRGYDAPGPTQVPVPEAGPDYCAQATTSKTGPLPGRDKKKKKYVVGQVCIRLGGRTVKVGGSHPVLTDGGKTLHLVMVAGKRGRRKTAKTRPTRSGAVSHLRRWIAELTMLSQCQSPCAAWANLRRYTFTSNSLRPMYPLFRNRGRIVHLRRHPLRYKKGSECLKEFEAATDVCNALFGTADHHLEASEEIELLLELHTAAELKTLMQDVLGPTHISPRKKKNGEPSTKAVGNMTRREMAESIVDSKDWLQPMTDKLHAKVDRQMYQAALNTWHHKRIQVSHMKRGTENESVVITQLAQFIKKHSDVTLAAAEDVGLVESAESRFVVCSPDHVVAIDLSQSHRDRLPAPDEEGGDYATAAVEIKSRFAATTISKREAVIRVIGKRRVQYVLLEDVTGNVDSDEIARLRQLIPDRGDRMQILTACCVLNVGTVLFVEATERYILYAVIVVVPTLVRQAIWTAMLDPIVEGWIEPLVTELEADGDPKKSKALSGRKLVLKTAGNDASVKADCHVRVALRAWVDINGPVPRLKKLIPRFIDFWNKCMGTNDDLIADANSCTKGQRGHKSVRARLAQHQLAYCLADTHRLRKWIALRKRAVVNGHGTMSAAHDTVESMRAIMRKMWSLKDTVRAVRKAVFGVLGTADGRARQASRLGTGASRSAEPIAACPGCGESMWDDGLLQSRTGDHAVTSVSETMCFPRFDGSRNIKSWMRMASLPKNRQMPCMYPGCCRACRNGRVKKHPTERMPMMTTKVCLTCGDAAAAATGAKDAGPPGAVYAMPVCTSSAGRMVVSVPGGGERLASCWEAHHSGEFHERLACTPLPDPPRPLPHDAVSMDATDNARTAARKAKKKRKKAGPLVFTYRAAAANRTDKWSSRIGSRAAQKRNRRLSGVPRSSSGKFAPKMQPETKKRRRQTSGAPRSSGGKFVPKGPSTEGFATAKGKTTGSALGARPAKSARPKSAAVAKRKVTEVTKGAQPGSTKRVRAARSDTTQDVDNSPSPHLRPANIKRKIYKRKRASGTQRRSNSDTASDSEAGSEDDSVVSLPTRSPSPSRRGSASDEGSDDNDSAPRGQPPYKQYKLYSDTPVPSDDSDIPDLLENAARSGGAAESRRPGVVDRATAGNELPPNQPYNTDGDNIRPSLPTFPTAADRARAKREMGRRGNEGKVEKKRLGATGPATAVGLATAGTTVRPATEANTKVMRSRTIPNFPEARCRTNDDGNWTDDNDEDAATCARAATEAQQVAAQGAVARAGRPARVTNHQQRARSRPGFFESLNKKMLALRKCGKIGEMHPTEQVFAANVAYLKVTGFAFGRTPRVPTSMVQALMGGEGDGGARHIEVKIIDHVNTSHATCMQFTRNLVRFFSLIPTCSTWGYFTGDQWTDICGHIAVKVTSGDMQLNEELGWKAVLHESHRDFAKQDHIAEQRAISELGGGPVDPHGWLNASHIEKAVTAIRGPGSFKWTRDANGVERLPNVVLAAADNAIRHLTTVLVDVVPCLKTDESLTHHIIANTDPQCKEGHHWVSIGIKVGPRGGAPVAYPPAGERHAMGLTAVGQGVDDR